MASKDLNVIINAKDNASQVVKGFNNQLKKTGGTFKQTANKIQQNAGKITAVGGAAFAGLGFAIKSAISEATRAEEIENRFDATFNKTEDRMRDFVSNFSDKFGRAESQVQAMSATMAGTLKPATDLSEKQISGLTMETSEAAVALANYDERVRDSEHAMQIMTKAMVGNRQSLIDLGFNVDKSVVKQKALEEGMIKSGEELDSTSEALATQKLIMEQSKVPLDALNNGNTTLAEKQRRLNSSFMEVKQTLGETFIPIMNNLIETIQPIIQNITNWISENKELTKKIVIITGAIGALVTVIGGLGLILGPIITAVTTLGAVIGAISAPIWIVIGVVAALAVAWKTNFLGIRDKTKEVIDFIRPYIINALGVIKKRWEQVNGDLFKIVKNYWNLVKTTINTVLDLLKKSIKGWTMIFKGIWENRGDEITMIAKKIWNWIKRLFKDALNVLNETIKFFTNILKGNWEKAFNNLLNIVKTIGKLIIDAFRNLISNLSKIFEKITDAMIGLGKDIVNGIISGIKSIGSQIKNTIMGFVPSIGDIKGAIGGAAKSAGGAIQGAAGAVSDIFRADGGPVKSGQSYIVGERGPELFTPGRNGNITPNEQMGGTININMGGVVVNNEADENRLVDKIKKELIKETKAFNSGII